MRCSLLYSLASGAGGGGRPLGGPPLPGPTPLLPPPRGRCGPPWLVAVGRPSVPGGGGEGGGGFDSVFTSSQLHSLSPALARPVYPVRVL